MSIKKICIKCGEKFIAPTRDYTMCGACQPRRQFAKRTIICPICRKTVEVTSNRRKYCTECSPTDGKKYQKIDVCLCCGREYIKHHALQLYCSPVCKKKMNSSALSATKGFKYHLSKTCKELSKQGVKYADYQKQKTLESIPKIDVEAFMKNL